MTLVVGGGSAMLLAYGREKDVAHARALLRCGPDLKLVERRIEELMDRGVRGAADAADFLDDLREGE